MSAEAMISSSRRAAQPTAVDGDAPPRTWFEASTGAGSVRLRITGAVRHAADAAIVLHRCSELIDALEDWTATPLAWRWIGSPLPSAAESHAVAVWRFAEDLAAGRDDSDADEPGWRVELPWTLLRALPAPEGTLAPRLRWLPVSVILTAAQTRITADELDSLEPGGAVILPESFGADWRGLLRGCDEPARPGLGMPVALCSPPAARRVAARACQELNAADGSDDAWCEVRLDGLRTVAADRLAGWYEGDLGEIGTRASLWRCATDLQPPLPLAAGTLMPWADGWALSVEAICEPARPSAGSCGDAPAAFAVPA